MTTPDTLSPPEAPRGSPWFFYPLAAVVVGAVLFSPVGDSQTPKLRPDQQRAVELSLQGVDPAMLPFMRETMAKNLAPYGEAQIALMIAALEKENAGKSSGAKQAANASENEAPAELSPADFEYNRKQYEPVIRKAHATQKSFDDFVNARLTAKCAKPDEVARWGSAWRYDLIRLKENHETASWNADIDVQVLGSTYAPQDGRYNFDFSKVRYTFDEAAIGAAIDQACKEYNAQGKTFLSQLDPLIAAQNWEGAHKLEMRASGWVDPIRTRLDAALDKHSPNHGYPLFAALQNGKRVKS